MVICGSVKTYPCRYPCGDSGLWWKITLRRCLSGLSRVVHSWNRAKGANRHCGYIITEFDIFCAAVWQSLTSYWFQIYLHRTTCLLCPGTGKNKLPLSQQVPFKISLLKLQKKPNLWNLPTATGYYSGNEPVWKMMGINCKWVQLPAAVD